MVNLIFINYKCPVEHNTAAPSVALLPLESKINGCDKRNHSSLFFYQISAAEPWRRISREAEKIQERKT